MAEDCHSRLKSCLALDVPGEPVADASLREADVAEGVLLALAGGLRFQLRDLRAFRDDDDAEQLAFSPASVQVCDDLVQADLELGDEDQARAARKTAHQPHPTGLATHDLPHHHAMARGSDRME